MTFSFVAKASILMLFLGSTLYVHLRGRARLPLLRQFVNHSALFAPYNALMYLFSRVPSEPYLDRSKFPELDILKDNWEAIRDEAMHLFDEGYIRAAEKNNDAGFGSFFKKGWKRFYLKWYDKALPSAEALCPKTVELVNSIPNVKGAMFALLPGDSHLNPHRDPFAGSCVITWACLPRTPMPAGSLSMARSTPGATVRTSCSMRPTCTGSKMKPPRPG